MCVCLYVYIWAYGYNISIRKISGIQYKLKINENVYMIPSILLDSCIDNGMFCCAHVVFKRCTFFVSIIFCHQLFNASLNFKCIKFSTPKTWNSSTYIYVQTHSCVSPEYIKWYSKKVSFVLAFNFISPHDYWHVARMHILKMIWVNRCFRQHQMMWSFRTIKLHYIKCQ